MSSQEIEVDKKIVALPIGQRRIASLTIGYNYYVSFRRNIVEKCRLIEHDPIGKTITIEQENVSNNKANRGTILKTKFYLFEDEIGDSPEHAVQNSN
jgi:hypothetical protein